MGEKKRHKVMSGELTTHELDLLEQYAREGRVRAIRQSEPGRYMWVVVEE